MIRIAAPIALASLLGLGGPVAGQDSTTPSSSPPPPCSEASYRDFDFWIGDWEVRDSAGQLQGHNTITSILGGCVLAESWRGVSGSTGESYNIFDRRTGLWHQTWVDNSGLLLQIDGGLDGNSMVMRGSGKASDGRAVEHEIRWTPLEDGRVRQHWRTSNDDGETWSDAFVGFYARLEGDP